MLEVPFKVINKLFPSYLKNDLDIVYSMLPLNRLTPHMGDRFAFIGTEKIATDCRIYNEWHGNISSLSNIQNRILSTLYTKHHDGYRREKCLREIISFDDEWIPPFILSLLGEYVIEIVNVINENKEALARKESYLSFIKRNPDFLHLIESRSISYWNCYHRHDGRYERMNDYPGIICLKYLAEKT
jgi:hypothetical protein